VYESDYSISFVNAGFDYAQPDMGFFILSGGEV